MLYTSFLQNFHSFPKVNSRCSTRKLMFFNFKTLQSNPWGSWSCLKNQNYPPAILCGSKGVSLSFFLAGWTKMRKTIETVRVYPSSPMYVLLLHMPYERHHALIRQRSILDRYCPIFFMSKPITVSLSICLAQCGPPSLTICRF